MQSPLDQAIALVIDAAPAVLGLLTPIASALWIYWSATLERSAERDATDGGPSSGDRRPSSLPCSR